LHQSPGSAGRNGPGVEIAFCLDYSSNETRVNVILPRIVINCFPVGKGVNSAGYFAGVGKKKENESEQEKLPQATSGTEKT
jgi:hypothetical protein